MQQCKKSRCKIAEMTTSRVLGGVVALVAIYIALWYRRQGFPTITPSQMNPQYDYIVVGGGSAGSVLAARLSEDPQISVLLLEAGSDGHSHVHKNVPGLVPLLQQSSIDWQYKTVPQKHGCNGLNENVSFWPRGKLLGGTSVLNYMLHNRGNRADYDRWESEFGCEGWGWGKVLPYFRKLETFHPIKDAEKDFLRGYEGPISCTYAPETQVSNDFLAAVVDEGYSVHQDLSSDVQHGFGRAQFSIKDGLRVSASEGYLRPASSRSNLHIVTQAHVTKINFNEEKRAVGVDYSFEGKMRRVLVNYEIIVSAGTVESPHLLMLSGIGPKKTLDTFKIPETQDMPAVGQNLQDHLLVNLQYTVNTSTGIDPNKEATPWGALRTGYNYLMHGTGTLSWSLVESFGFLKSELSPDEQEYPDMQLYFFPTDTLWEGFFSYLVNLKNDVSSASTAKMKGGSGVTLASSLLHPKSRGEIRLKSADPFVPPDIDPNYLSNKHDVAVLVEGLKLLRQIIGNSMMAGHSPESAEDPMPGCENMELWSDEYLVCLTRLRTFSVYHPVGTCRMGKDPTTSVVDNRLKVHGITGLRVVDASIFPSTVSGNPNVPVIMVAEKAADLIKEDLHTFK